MKIFREKKLTMYLVVVSLTFIFLYHSKEVFIVHANKYENTAIGTGLIQLWQVVPDGQQYKEGATTSEIMNALKCKPNHDLLPLSGGKNRHSTYVNSCYVDDALYLGGDENYYYIYLSGYEGKVAKSKSHLFELDLNNDGISVDYEIQTVAYFIPDLGNSTKYISEDNSNILQFSSDYLDKYSSNEKNGIATASNWNIKSVSYYKNESGTLMHYITNNIRATNYSKFVVGKSPSWMNENKKYYSYDGIYFYSRWQDIHVNGIGAINQTNPFYNYYGYLPIRSKSNYSSSIIDSFTNANVGSESKLFKTGIFFSNAQSNFGINGTLQYAMGIHESGWGKSSLSINKNNLFGMNATDNNPYGNGTSFPNVEAGINYHAERYLSWGYTDPIDDYRFYGSHLGNKGSGMNVKYASDPFWGEKISGWYYKIDKKNNFNDYNYYTIGIKQNIDNIEVKSDANPTSKRYYRMMNKKSNISIVNYPVIITSTKDNYYKIKLDTPLNSRGDVQYSAKYNWDTANGYVESKYIYVSNLGKYNIQPYIGWLDNDLSGKELSGTVNLKGWYIYGRAINEVELYVDNEKVTNFNREYREDIATVYPDHETSKAGISVKLDTRAWQNGWHEIKIVAKGSDGTQHEMKWSVSINNKLQPYIGWLDNDLSGKELSGTINLKGWYIYGRAINEVELYVDNEKVTNFNREYREDIATVYPDHEISKAGISVKLDTRAWQNGWHEIKIVAKGSDGTQHEMKWSVSINNKLQPYIGWLDNDLSGKELSGTINLKGWYIYGRAINEVELYVDNEKVTNFNREYREDIATVYPDHETSKAGISVKLDTRAWQNGWHEIKIVAKGSDGTQHEMKWSVSINNKLQPYIGWLDNDLSGKELSGTINLKGWYIYGRAINEVELYVDNEKVTNFNREYREDIATVYPDHETSKAGISVKLDTRAWQNGWHEIKIVAKGSDGTQHEMKWSIPINN